MKYPNLISKFNWRLMLIHFIAMWFFIQAFAILSYLTDPNIVEAISTKSRLTAEENSKVVSLLIWTSGGPFIGLLIALIISLLLCIKKKWFWLNSVIVFLIAYLLRRFDIDGWAFLKYIFLSPGNLFNRYSTGQFLANGLPMLAIGLFIFFSKRINRFIDGGSHIDESLPLTVAQ